METVEVVIPPEAGIKHIQSECIDPSCPAYGSPVHEDFASGCAGLGPCPIHGDTDPGDSCPDPYRPCQNSSHNLD
jgi:hypothetical protein